MRPTLADNTEDGVRDFVRRYFRAAFPRSPAYMNAFEAAITKRVRGVPDTPGDIACPYATGTAEADAWIAGYAAGRETFLDGVH